MNSLPDTLSQKSRLKSLLMAVVLKDEKAWKGLYNKLRDAYTRAWTGQMEQAIIAGLDRLRELGPGKFTEADGALILSTMEGRVGVDAMQGALRGPVLNLGEGVFREGAGGVGESLGVDIAFLRPDLDALDIIGQGNMYWVGNSWNVSTEKALQAILTDYFTDGMTRQQLTDRFAEDFAGVSERGRVYWELLADHTATRTREMGRVTGYERARVKQVQVRAHIDGHTTEICRAMHGRVITVAKLHQQRETYLDAVRTRDMEAAKAAWTMHGDAGAVEDVRTSKLPQATASPPYHFRCRTITVAYFEASKAPQDLPARSPVTVERDQVDGWRRKVFDRVPLSKADTDALIARSRHAKWGSHTLANGKQTAREHAERHGRQEMGLSMADYNQSAIDLIRQADRDVFLGMSKQRLVAYFTRRLYKKKGRWRVLRTVVDVEDNTIKSHFKRTDKATPFSVEGHDIYPAKLPARGITKWFIS